VTSVVSYAGIGILLVCLPAARARKRLGGPARGALLISADPLVASLNRQRRIPGPQAGGAAGRNTRGARQARW